MLALVACTKHQKDLKEGGGGIFIFCRCSLCTFFMFLLFAPLVTHFAIIHFGMGIVYFRFFNKNKEHFQLSKFKNGPYF